jgi:hypothetical protein
MEEVREFVGEWDRAEARNQADRDILSVRRQLRPSAPGRAGRSWPGTSSGCPLRA